MRLSPTSLFAKSKPCAPRGHRAYVVGDIHGRLDLLEQLLDLIEQDVRKRRNLKNTIVFLGDLIDRGPASAEVVERLRTYRPNFANSAFVMGNHEEVLLRVIDGDSTLLGQWLKFGGAECLRSYGSDPNAIKNISSEQAIALVRRSVPHTHAEFLRSFADTISFGGYLFVHAGVRPGTSLADQSQSDLRWIREPFLEDDCDHGFVVVHGHTISERVELRSNRIGIDTGAYRTGILTALCIEGTDRWLLQSANAMAQSTGPRRLASA